MALDYRCFFCFSKAFEKLLEQEKISKEAKTLFTCDMAAFYQNSCEKLSAPEFSRGLHIMLRHYTNNPDPYYEIKKESNCRLIEKIPVFKQQIQSSSDPFETASRLAIAGNIIDYATDGEFNLEATIEKVLTSEFAINHLDKLRAALSKAKSVLYLGDNAGEIVFDRLFIEEIKHPKVYFAVRGAPIINDVTLEDARLVEMDKVAKVISNGYNAPSTILEHCSDEFRNIFSKADVVISKGQGNLEGLIGTQNKEIFFLLMVKCNVIAELLKVNKGSFVVKNN